MSRVSGRWFAVAVFSAFVLAVFIDGRLSMAWISYEAGVQELRFPSFLDAYARYDSGWYHSIASRGYFYSGPDVQSSVAFFPA